MAVVHVIWTMQWMEVRVGLIMPLPLIGLSRHHIHVLQVVVFPLEMGPSGRVPFPVARTEILSDEGSKAVGKVALVDLLGGV